MKANEFVKKHGLEEARRLLNIKKPNTLDIYYYGWGFYTIELKHIVESYDLVESHGGLEKAKSHRDYLVSFGSEFAGVSKESIESLNQAIADVEACQ